MERNFLNADDVGIAFIYCNYKEHQVAVDMVGSLLQQLLQRKSTISKEIVALYQSHTIRKTHPTIAELSTLLQAETRELTKLFVVVDALDECPEADRVKLLSELKKLQPILRLLVTGRPHIDSVAQRFQETSKLEVRASDDDIKAYLEGRIENAETLKPLIGKQPKLRNFIISTIVEQVKGMYVFHQISVSCVADIL